MAESDHSPPTGKRTVVRSVRMSADENALFEEFCVMQDVTVSEGMRRLARGAALLGPTFPDSDRAEIIALTRQLRGIGINLNQAVHHLNAGGVIQGENMAALLNGVRGSIEELDNAYRSMCARTHRRAAQIVADAAA